MHLVLPSARLLEFYRYRIVHRNISNRNRASPHRAVISLLPLCFTCRDSLPCSERCLLSPRSEADPIQANNDGSEVVSHMALPGASRKNAGRTAKALTTNTRAEFTEFQFNHRAKHPSLGDTLDYLI